MVQFRLGASISWPLHDVSAIALSLLHQLDAIVGDAGFAIMLFIDVFVEQTHQVINLVVAFVLEARTVYAKRINESLARHLHRKIK